MGKSTGITLMLLGLSLSMTAARAGEAEMDRQARHGTVRCGGSNFLQQNGAESHSTSYNFRNLSSTTPITIDRIVFWDATGGVLFDSVVSGFPTFQNAILGPSDQALGPNQSADLDTLTLLPFLPQNRRPVQMEATWSAPAKVLTLDVSFVSITRERDSITGAELQERSRAFMDCRTIGTG